MTYIKFNFKFAAERVVFLFEHYQKIHHYFQINKLIFNRTIIKYDNEKPR